MKDSKTTQSASRLQKAQTVKIMRSEINLDDFNPRTISDSNKKRLKKSIEKFGWIGAPVFNRRTGHIVGGHQRLSALDSLMGKADYELDVIEVDLSEREELKLNVALNNTDMQGEYDFGAINSLCKEFDIDPVNDLLFSEELASVEFPDFDCSDAGFGSVPKKEVSEEEKEEYRAARRDRAEKHRKHDEEFGNYNIDELKGVLTVVFKSESDKRMFMSSHGLPEEKRAVSFDDLKQMMNGEL